MSKKLKPPTDKEIIKVLASALAEIDEVLPAEGDDDYDPGQVVMDVEMICAVALSKYETYEKGNIQKVR